MPRESTRTKLHVTSVRKQSLSQLQDETGAIFPSPESQQHYITR